MAVISRNGYYAYYATGRTGDNTLDDQLLLSAKYYIIWETIEFDDKDEWHLMCKTFGFQAINTNTEDLMPDDDDEHAAEFGGSTHAELDKNIWIQFLYFFLASR